MILFLHNRYRSTGGEERAVADLMWLAREHLHEDVELIEADSARIGRGRAAVGMLRGGLHPQELARVVRRRGARVVHAHNLHPAFGWRTLAAARAAGARVVLHLHQYRLVCAVGICFTDGQPCVRCHGRNSLPGVVHRCREGTAESLVYATAIAGWQRRLAATVDVFVVPSAFAQQRLLALGAPLGDTRILPHPIREFATRSHAGAGGYALFAGRLEPEKGLGIAIEACRQNAIPLVVAGEGSERARFAGAPGVEFRGSLEEPALAALRTGAGLALMPSRTAESFGLVAAESMAAGLPLVAHRIGALAEIVPAEGLVAPEDPAAFASAAGRLMGDAAAGERGLEAIRSRLDPASLAATLAAIYAAG